MPLLDYVTLGGVELANHVRLAQYLSTVGSPLTVSGPCVCPTLTAEMLGDLPYTNPADDEAPWYDPDVPDSEEFAGVLLLSIDGLDSYPVKRSVTNAITGGGSIGPARVLPRELTFTVVLLGATCCGVEYGLHWLSEMLQGCAGNSCDGDCMSLFSCCPGEELTPECMVEEYRRTIRRVVLVDGPNVVSRTGDGCTAGECQVGADILTVEFTLVAATPWLWTEPVPVRAIVPTSDTGDECVTWCIIGTPENPTEYCAEVVEECTAAGALPVPVTDGACATGLEWPVDEDETCTGPCRFAVCPDVPSACTDSRCQPPTPPTVVAPATCYCQPIAVETSCCLIDLTDFPGWAVDVPIITVRAGATDLRNVTITFYERDDTYGDMTCAEIADAEICNPHSVYMIGFVPAGGAVTLDGQIQRSIVECGGTCETSPDVYGRDGAPPSWEPFNCARYCVCVETDVLNPPAEDSLITISMSGRGM